MRFDGTQVVFELGRTARANDRHHAAVAALAPAGTMATAGLLAAAALGLLGAGLHVHLMWSALKTGMRKRLGLSFVLVKAGWVLLLLGFPVAALTARAWRRNAGSWSCS